MSNIFGVIEHILPLFTVILSVISLALGYFGLRRSNREIIALKDKFELQTKSKVIEEHKELPGFQNRVDSDDLE